MKFARSCCEPLFVFMFSSVYVNPAGPHKRLAILYNPVITFPLAAPLLTLFALGLYVRPEHLEKFMYFCSLCGPCNHVHWHNTSLTLGGPVF